MENVILPEKLLDDLLDSQESVTSRGQQFKTSGAKYLIYGASLMAVVIGLAALLGMLTGLPILVRWIPAATKMVSQSAMSSIAAAVGFWAVQAEKRALIKVISILLQFLGWLNLIVTSPEIGSHHVWILADPDVRMAPGSAVAFILLGIGLAILSRVKLSMVVLWAIALLGVGVTGIGLVTLVAYGTGLAAVSWWGGFSLPMAVPTAVAIFCLGMALTASFFQRSKEASRHLSIAAAVLAILGLLLLFAGVDAAVLVSSNSVLKTRMENRKTTTEVRAIQSLVDFARKSEAGQRGYLLTRDLPYLETFDAGVKGYAQLLLDHSIHDAKLLQTAARKFEELSLTVNLEKQGHHNEAVLVVRSADGLRYMDEIEARAKLLTGAMLKVNLARQTESQRSILSVRQTILFSYGLAVLFAGGALLLVGFDVRRRSRIETKLRTNETEMISALQAQTLRAEEASRAKSSFLVR